MPKQGGPQRAGSEQQQAMDSPSDNPPQNEEDGGGFGDGVVNGEYEGHNDDEMAPYPDQMACDEEGYMDGENDYGEYYAYEGGEQAGVEEGGEGILPSEHDSSGHYEEAGFEEEEGGGEGEETSSGGGGATRGAEEQNEQPSPREAFNKRSLVRRHHEEPRAGPPLPGAKKHRPSSASGLPPHDPHTSSDEGPGGVETPTTAQTRQHLEKLRGMKLRKAEVLKNLRKQMEQIRAAVERQLSSMEAHINHIAASVTKELGKYEARCLEQIKANNQKQLCLQNATVLWEQERPAIEKIVNVCYDLS